MSGYHHLGGTIRHSISSSGSGKYYYEGIQMRGYIAAQDTVTTENSNTKS